jgi:hypothetical protein
MRIKLSLIMLLMATAIFAQATRYPTNVRFVGGGYTNKTPFFNSLELAFDNVRATASNTNPITFQFDSDTTFVSDWEDYRDSVLAWVALGKLKLNGFLNGSSFQLAGYVTTGTDQIISGSKGIYSLSADKVYLGSHTPYTVNPEAQLLAPALTAVADTGEVQGVNYLVGSYYENVADTFATRKSIRDFALTIPSMSFDWSGIHSFSSTVTIDSLAVVNLTVVPDGQFILPSSAGVEANSMWFDGTDLKTSIAGSNVVLYAQKNKNNLLTGNNVHSGSSDYSVGGVLILPSTVPAQQGSISFDGEADAILYERTDNDVDTVATRAYARSVAGTGGGSGAVINDADESLWTTWSSSKIAGYVLDVVADSTGIIGVDSTKYYQWTNKHKWTDSVATSTTLGQFDLTATGTGQNYKGVQATITSTTANITSTALGGYANGGDNSTVNGVLGSGIGATNAIVTGGNFGATTGAGSSARAYGIKAWGTGGINSLSYAGYFGGLVSNDGNVYIKDKLEVGSSKFYVDGNGNITKLNNIAYSFPSTAGSDGNVLMIDTVNVDGSLGLKWMPSSGGGGVNLASNYTWTGNHIFRQLISLGEAGVGDGAIRLFNNTTAYSASIYAENITTSDKTIQLPNASGTLALLGTNQTFTGNNSHTGTNNFTQIVSLGTQSTGDGAIKLWNNTNAYAASLYAENIASSDKTLQLPNETGTLATQTYAANASNLSSGTVGTARLGSGTANNTTFLRGDGAWATPSTGSATAGGSTTQIQYNNSGTLAGISGVTTDGTNITVTGTLTTTNGTTVLGATSFNVTYGSLVLPRISSATVGNLWYSSAADKLYAITSGSTSRYIADNRDIDLLTPLTRTITINGVAQTLAADRSWTVTSSVDQTANYTWSGTHTFNNSIAGNITGNAATVTNGIYTTGTQNLTGLKRFYANIEVGQQAATTGSIVFQNAGASGTITLTSPASSSSTTTLTLPSGNGSYTLATTSDLNGYANKTGSNTYTSANTYEGNLVLNGEVSQSIGSNTSVSIAGKNAMFLSNGDGVSYTVGLLSPSDGQVLFVTVTGAPGGACVVAGTSVGVGKSVYMRYRSSTTTWYATTP